MNPDHKEYPKVKYHPAQGSRVVHNAQDDENLGDEWYNNPGEFGVVTAPSANQMHLKEQGIQPIDKTLAEAQKQDDPMNQKDFNFGNVPKRRR